MKKIRFFIFFLLLFGFIASCGSEIGSSDEDTITIKKNNSTSYRDLLSKAQSQGSVRVIVKLKMPFTPEGELSSPSQVASQRAQIKSAQTELLNSLSNYNIKGVKRFETIPYISMEVDAQTLSALSSHPLVEHIYEDALNFPKLQDSVPLIKADQVWNLGYTGDGWVVAVLDTGVDKNHPFLSGKVVAEACFSTTSSQYNTQTLCPNGQNEQRGPGAGVNCPITINGCEHGTHVAGIVAGKSTNRNGVAKDAKIISVQVFSRIGNSVGAFTSDVVKGLEYVYSLRTTYNIASVNMSLGGGAYSSHCDNDMPFYKDIIDNLRSVGIAAIAASGNESQCDSITAPACISSAISVGATTKQDQEATFSNYAPILSLFAPGVDITSSVPESGYQALNGTSMATPHVAGAWALIKQRFPEASVDDILNAFKSTGKTISPKSGCSISGNYPQKRIDVLAAMNYLAEQKQLTITKTGNGSGEISAEGCTLSWQGNIGTCKAPKDTQITLTATPSQGSVFTGWSNGTGSVNCTGTDPCTFTITQDSSITANFDLAEPRVLTITKEGNGSGNVTVTNCTLSWEGNVGTCVAPKDAQITLTATPSQGSVFTGWSNGTGSANCTGTDPCSFTITQDSSITATFKLPERRLTITKAGNGSGEISAEGCTLSWQGNIGTCKAPKDTQITLTATPSQGSVFAGWSNGTGSANCTGTDPCTFTITQDSTITATFKLPERQLTITKAGNGNGYITIAGCILIWQGNTGTCKALHGKSITLMATPSQGSVFVGWSNGTGSANCTGTVPCTFTITQDSSITANFNKQAQESSSGGSSGGSTGEGSVSSGGGGCSMGSSASPVNSLLWLLIPAIAIVRRFIRK